MTLRAVSRSPLGRAPLGLALALLLGACSGEDEPVRDSSCTDIIHACHPVDQGLPGPINDCHELGHENRTSDCQAQRDACVALCEAAAADGGGDAAIDH